nr:hypothetical protein [Tanacetum cinerariifolium]
MCELACQIIQKKQEEKWIEEEQVVNAQYWKIHDCCDDDNDYNFAITPILSTKEPDNSLSIGDEHLDTISTTKSDEVINSSVEDLVPIPSESEGILDTMCDVHLVKNPTPLEAKDHFEIVINSNDDFSSSDDDSLYNENIEDFCCSKGNVEDKILVPKLLKNCARCVRCGHPVDGSYCQGCALLRKKLKEDLDHGVNSSQNPPHVDECCYKCGDALDGIFCQQCTCKSCGKGAHIGYNCPSKVSIISNPEPCNQTMNNELPQTLPSFDPTCYLDKENSVPCVSKPNLVDEFSNIFNPPPQPPIYSCAFCGSNAQYGHYCTPQVPFINPEPGYSQDFNFPQDIHDFQQQYLCCDQCGGPHDTFQSKDHFKIVINSNDDIYSSDDDSLYNENIEYVEASPHDSEVVSLEVAEIAIPEDEEIEDDNLREKLLNVNLLIAKIEALKVNPTPSSVFLTKSSSTSLKFFLEVTNTFHNSLPEFENFCFDLEEISSGSTTTHSNISLSDYEAFYFFPPTDRSDFTHEEFADKLAHIISPPEYDCFYFRNFPDPGKWIPILNSRIRKNLSSTTHVSLPVEDDHSPLLVYVVWIFLGYLTYPVIPPYLHSFRNEDTIFDPGITINRFYSFKLGLSHRCGTFKKFNTHRSHLNESSMEMLFSTCFPMDH